jgi:hypothetical protein
LNLSPQIGFLASLLFYLMPLPITIIKSIWTEDNLAAVLNYGFACHENVESAVTRVVYSQLMAV